MPGPSEKSPHADAETTSPAGVPWTDAPRVRLDADLPPAERFAQLPAGPLAACRELIADLRRHLPTGAGGLALAVNARTKGRWRAEAEALAPLLETTWAEVLVANCTYDLALSGFACSTAAVATPEGPILARNMDWAPPGPLARASLLKEEVSATGVTVWNAGWPGGIGCVTGQSSRGFALALNAVSVPRAPDLLGCPVLLFLRRVLEDAASFEDAVVRVRRERLVCGAIVTLVGTDNAQRVVVERTPKRSGVIWAGGDGPLVATNHLRQLGVAGDAETPDVGVAGDTRGRLDALACGLAGTTGTDAALLYALTEPDVMQRITAQHVLCRPGVGAVRMAVPTALLSPGAGGW